MVSGFLPNATKLRNFSKSCSLWAIFFHVFLILFVLSCKSRGKYPKWRIQSIQMKGKRQERRSIQIFHQHQSCRLAHISSILLIDILLGDIGIFADDGILPLCRLFFVLAHAGSPSYVIERRISQHGKIFVESPVHHAVQVGQHALLLSVWRGTFPERLCWRRSGLILSGRSSYGRETIHGGCRWLGFRRLWLLRRNGLGRVSAIWNILKKYSDMAIADVTLSAYRDG